MRNSPEESLDTSHSPALEPVCEALRTLYEPLAAEPLPNDLTRLIEALDDAYVRGDLFSPQRRCAAASTYYRDFR